MNKLIFFLKRPPVVLVAGKDRIFIKETISRILTSEVLIFESDFTRPKKTKNFKFFLKKSKLPILVIGDIEKTEGIRELARALPAKGFLILNFNNEATKELKKDSSAQFLTYGFQEGPDLKATDINISSEGINFKVDYQGKIVPFWLKNISEKEQICGVLAAICVGIIKEINLVEISQSLRK